NPRLILDLHRAQRGEQLLHQVVFFIVKRRAAEAGEPERAPRLLAVDLLLPALAPRFDHPVGDHVHRLIQVKIFPVMPERTAVLDPVLPRVPRSELEARRPLRTQAAPAYGRVGIALDLDDLLVLNVDVLPAADRAVRAHRLDDPVRCRDARLDQVGVRAPDGFAQAKPVGACELPVDGPSIDESTYTHVFLATAAGRSCS